MVEVKTIKDIDEKTWSEFKSLAAINNMKLRTFFKTLVREHEVNNNHFWKTILKGKKIISDADAKELENLTKKTRKEYGFRI